MPETHFTPVFKDTVIVMAAVESSYIDTDLNSETFGHFIVTYKNGDSTDYGIVTAYAAAVHAGYTGTEAEWSAELATLRALATGKKFSDGQLVDLAQGDEGYHNNARYYSEIAGTAATNASVDRYIAEGYALGTQNGADVISGNTYYQNNAKWHKEQAANAAAAATEKQTIATNAATEAGRQSSAAANSKLAAEGYAIGTQDNVDVESGSTYYHNNAKYYAEQTAAKKDATLEDALKAEGYARGSQNSTDVSSGTYYQNNAKYYKEFAGTEALKAEGYADGTQNGTDVASGSPYYQNNAKYYSEQAYSAKTDAVAAKGNAETAETNATSKAGEALASALKAEGFAVGKQNNTDVASGSDYYQNSAKYYKEKAAASYAALSNMTVGVTTGAAGTSASVVKSVVNNVDHLQFTIPRGEQGVHIGSSAPTDPDVLVWIDPTGGTDINLMNGVSF